jgi:DNA-binding Lrp family transcriptional regulator
MTIKRYILAEFKKKFYIISNSSMRIVNVLRKNNNLSYNDLTKNSSVPIASLYVFCKRLEDAGIISRKKVFNSMINRTYTQVHLDVKVKFHELNIVR